MELTVEKDGFHGVLYRPETDVFSGKALIAFGGSDGRFPLTCMLAEIFQRAGLTTLALAYWNAPGLPEAIAALPVESVERAALWLRGQGYENLSLRGTSKGGELALLAGSLLPELISCVVAVCPWTWYVRALMHGKSSRCPAHPGAGAAVSSPMRPSSGPGGGCCGICLFAMTRKYPEQCAQSRADALQNTLAFLKEW